jgi:hypothetical protein
MRLLFDQNLSHRLVAQSVVEIVSVIRHRKG